MENEDKKINEEIKVNTKEEQDSTTEIVENKTTEQVDKVEETQPLPNEEKIDETVKVENDPMPTPPTNSTDVKPKKNHKIAKILGCCALVIAISGATGYGAGYFAAKNYISENSQEITIPQGPFNNENGNKPNEDFSQNNQNGQNNNGPQGDFGNFNPNGSDETSSTPALGITVSSEDSGLVVMGFSTNSKAEAAGIEIGDILVSIDGESCDSLTDVQQYLATKQIGDTVELIVSRDSNNVTIQVELVERSNASFEQNIMPEFDDEDAIKS